MMRRPFDIDKAKFKSMLSEFSATRGMMTNLAAASFVVLIQEQKARKTVGNIVEFGVFAGRSATLLKNFVSPAEKLLLVDKYIQPEVEKLEAAGNIQIARSASEDIIDALGHSIGEYAAKCKVVHSDGSHEYDNVYNDISVADKFLKEDGLLILDDFVNVGYPQVQPATYEYIRNSHDSRETLGFDIFLIGANKAWLCRPSHKAQWMNFVRDNFVEHMEEIGFKTMLIKTDRNRKFDVFSFREREAGHTKFYHEKVYARFYKA